jgi:hypothetical protein
VVESTASWPLIVGTSSANLILVNPRCWSDRLWRPFIGAGRLFSPSSRPLLVLESELRAHADSRAGEYRAEQLLGRIETSAQHAVHLNRLDPASRTLTN